jgi:benzil reductase ((S)-benzoin forming)
LGKSLVNVLLREKKNSVVGISRTNDLVHPGFRHIRMDFNQPESLSELADSIFSTGEYFEKIVLINNAGYLGPIKYIGDINHEELIRIYNVNLIAPAILTNSFVRAYKNRHAEKIILNIGSGASKTPYDGWAGYCSSKAGIDMLSKVGSMESELRKYEFKVISLAPGIIETEMQQQIRNASEKDFSSLVKFKTLKKENSLLSPEEAALGIARFLNDKSRHQDVVQDIRQLK